MKILVDMGHPAHVHFFKNFIREMKERGHEFVVTVRDKDVSLQLLEAYGIDHIVVGKMGSGKLGLIKEWLDRDRKILSIAKSFRPQILLGIHNPSVAHVARLIGAKSITFTDTEHPRLANLLTFPFTDVICTPACFKNNLGKKQVRYNGYHELAYLHPDYFTPDSSVLNEIGLKAKDKYIVVRFVSWGAAHDIGKKGLDMVFKKRLINELEKHCKVFVSSEVPLPVEFAQYEIKLPPERMHDLLNYATLYIGEGGTMASESAVLGTPAIYINTLRLGYLEEQERQYGLVGVYSNPDLAESGLVGRAIYILGIPKSKEVWAKKRAQLLQDKIDVTKFIVQVVEDNQRENRCYQVYDRSHRAL